MAQWMAEGHFRPIFVQCQEHSTACATESFLLQTCGGAYAKSRSGLKENCTKLGPS